MLAIDSAVWRGGGGSISSIPDSGDFPGVGGVTCAADVRREGDCLEGVMPCSEFIEALRSSVGVDARASRLREDELLLKGLGGGALPLGDAVGPLL